MTRSQLPNAITVSRMVMALPLLWLLAQGHYRPALVLALVAGATDVLDGFLAKRYHWQSVLGGILDPVADKLLLSVCFLGLWSSQQLPTWLVAVIIVRDAVVAIGAWSFWKVTGSLQPAPTGISKAATLSQLLLVALVMAHLAGLDLLQRWVQPLMLAAAAATVVSGIHYVVSYSLRAWRGHRPGNRRAP
jgi:cardiolipin synthase (CMP-forming)